MTRLIAFLEKLGRKYTYCAGSAVLVLIGSLFAKPENFAVGSTALVSLAGIFCYGNVRAGLGAPGHVTTTIEQSEAVVATRKETIKGDAG